MGDALFEIDADIRVARTLPARVYSDPEIFRLERDRVFARTWHYAGHTDLVKVAGQVHPFTLDSISYRSASSRSTRRAHGITS